METDADWFQELIVCARHIGISKRELLEDYYYDEIPLIFKKYNDLHNPDKDEEVYWDQMNIR